MRHTVCIGIPVKNEINNLELLKDQLLNLIYNPKFNDIDFQVFINDNMSSDGSSEFLDIWQTSDSRVHVFLLKQPLDFQGTIKDLMSKSNSDAFALVQSDLQDPVIILEELISAWLKNPEYIVAGRITSRKDFFFTNLIRKFFYWLLSSTSGKIYPSGFQDFYVLPKYVYSQVAGLSNSGLFIRGFLNFYFTKIIFIDYKRDKRHSGKSNFKFNSMYDLALDGLLLYGKRFIRILSLLSFLIFSLSVIVILIILTMSVLGFDYGARGWASIVLGISILTSILGMLAGIILEYLIRIHAGLNLVRPSALNSRDNS